MNKKERNKWIGIAITYFLYVSIKFIFDSDFNPGYINDNFYIMLFFEDTFFEILGSLTFCFIVAGLIYLISKAIKAKLKFTTIFLVVSIILCSMVIGSFFLN